MIHYEREGSHLGMYGRTGGESVRAYSDSLRPLEQMLDVYREATRGGLVNGTPIPDIPTVDELFEAASCLDNDFSIEEWRGEYAAFLDEITPVRGR